MVGCGPFGTNSLRQTPVENIKEQEKMWNLGQNLFSSFLFSLLVAPVRIHFRIGELLASPDLSLPLPPYPLLFLSGIFSFPFIFYFSREREWGRRGDQQLFISGVWRYLFISAPFVVSCFVSCFVFFGRNFEFPARVKFKFPKRPSTTRRVEKEKKGKRKERNQIGWAGLGQ